MQILQTTGKEMFTMKRNTISEKKSKLIQDIVFFLFMQANALHKALKKENSMYFSFAS